VKTIKWLLILSFFSTSIYHLVRIISPDPGDDSNPERHAVFIAITLIASLIFYFDRPRSLLIFVPLIIQQLYSHGTFLYTEWINFDRIDWPSVFVLIGMPVLSFYIFQRIKTRKELLNGSQATS
jgi:hypothetical protein